MKFEHKDEHVASLQKYRNRILQYSLIAFAFLVVSLIIGTWGYWYFGQCNTVSTKPTVVDAFLCASMILTGMGPIGAMDTDGGKIFSALYAIYSGVAFLSMMAIFFAPIVHRFLHLMHMDEIESDN